MVSWAGANGGEGGIRTPGTLSDTTDFESVTFGHSATSPKGGQESRVCGLWQALTIGQSLTILLKFSAAMNNASRATLNKIKLARKFT